MEKILQADKFVSNSQPQIGDSKIYTGDPVSPLDAGRQFTRQPPADRTLKIYGGKQPATIRVKIKGAGDETLTINASDFDDDLHVLVEV